MKAVRTWPDGRIRKLFRIALPIMQGGSNDRADYRQSRSGGVPQGIKLSVPETAPDAADEALANRCIAILKQAYPDARAVRIGLPAPKGQLEVSLPRKRWW
jgi:hypothetical protein